EEMVTLYELSRPFMNNERQIAKMLYYTIAISTRIVIVIVTLAFGLIMYQMIKIGINDPRKWVGILLLFAFCQAGFISFEITRYRARKKLKEQQVL
ncbi:MAG TPA: hypothetical protein PLW14_12915, partial [Chlorobiota bacterium]|nr:hypothetical protein [Chlorobiota bacterium]